MEVFILSISYVDALCINNADKNPVYIKYENSSIPNIDIKCFVNTTCRKIDFTSYRKTVFVYITYRQFVYMWYGQNVLYILGIDKTVFVYIARGKFIYISYRQVVYT